MLATGPEGVFDYEIPDDLADASRPERLVEPGRRVRVPLGRGDRLVVGYCVEAGTKTTTGSPPETRGERRRRPAPALARDAAAYAVDGRLLSRARGARCSKPWRLPACAALPARAR